MPTFLQPYVDRLGGQRRALIALIGLATVVLILALSRWASAPVYVPVFSNVPLEQVTSMTDKLTAAGIQFRLERGGSQITVPTPKLAQTRVLLASEGMPSRGRPGLELFDQPSWGMTDFTQRVNYRRALEGELERTIGKMRGIEAAQVHLALHETQSFRRSSDTPGQASVVLRLTSGQAPADDVVRGIAQLVASSVDGLDGERVTVLDDAGRLLSMSDDPSSMSGMTSRQLAMQQEVERYLEGKAEDLVGQLVGPGNARVQVSAAMNFDRIERTVQSVDPDRQAVSTEQKAEITPGAEGGAASSNVATSYENSRSVETISAAVGDLRRLSVAVLVNDRLVPGADSASPPTVVARDQQEVDRIEALVRSAVGFDSARGDVVNVVSMPFAPTIDMSTPDPIPTLLDRVSEERQTLLGALGLLLAFIVAVLILRALRAVPALPAPLSPPALGTGESEDGADDDGVVHVRAPQHPAVLEARAPSATMVLRDQVLAGVEQNPEVAVRLVRSWMRES